MTVAELIVRLQKLGDLDANVVIAKHDGGLIAVIGVADLLADPNGELYTTLRTDEPIS